MSDEVETRKAFAEHRERVWGLGYRMLGTPSDADEVVQETFLSLLEHPPQDTTRDLAPWLTRVAMNKARDRLRRRKREPYTGCWLPGPVPDARLGPNTGSPAARYELRESASFAFLVAAEALTANQRAVLLLRDVLDHSVKETAAALELSEANVKTTLHRARKAMSAYDAERRPPDAALSAETEAVLGQLVACLSTGDADGLLALLRDDARSVSDGGGAFVAALLPIGGAQKVVRLLIGLSQGTDLSALTITPTRLNGVPALALDTGLDKEGYARRLVMRVDLDAQGKIRELHTVLAPDKLRDVSFQ